MPSIWGLLPQHAPVQFVIRGSSYSKEGLVLYQSTKYWPMLLGQYNLKDVDFSFYHYHNNIKGAQH